MFSRARAIRAIHAHAKRCGNSNRPIARQTSSQSAGSNVAYEEAIKLIDADKKERMEMLSRVEKEIARVTKANGPTASAQLSALDALRLDLQVKSELNDVEVRKNFAEGKIDMSRPVYRYLRQKQFEKLPRSKLLERVTQMRVIPDLLAPGLVPSVDVSVQCEGTTIEPGVVIKPELTINTPTVDVTNFHTDTRLYTILLVDPDSPDLAQKTYQQHCHWLVINVPLSTTQTRVQGGDTVLPYVPPHPQKGTRYHRYTLIAYEQPGKADIHVTERHSFDTKRLAEAHGLHARGVLFFREEWDASVSRIYQDVLQTKEPIYGKPPRAQRHIQPTLYL